MNANVLPPQGVQTPGGTLHVAPAPASDRPEPEPSKSPPKIVRDTVEINEAYQKQAAKSALDIRKDDLTRGGSKTYHDEVTDRFVVKVFNVNNEEIRQIPAEELLRIAARFQQITGLLFDEKY